jgi:CoA:oxalate CoA-transferase
VNPRIISASVTGYGLTGPDKEGPAVDLVIQARGGIMSFTGEPGRPPVRMGAPLGDLGGGAFAAHGILAALYRRERTGAGGKVDVSLLDCQLYLASYRAQYYLTAGEVARPMGTGHVSAVPVGAFECGDGGWLVMDAILPHFWEGLCGALDRPGWRDHVNAELAGVFATAPAAHWLARLAAHGVPAGPIQTIDQALADPQVRAREMVVEMEHHALGSIETFNSPIKMEGTWGAAPSPPPLLGEHTEEVLREMLEMGEDEIARLRARGAI